MRKYNLLDAFETPTDNKRTIMVHWLCKGQRTAQMLADIVIIPKWWIRIVNNLESQTREPLGRSFYPDMNP